MVFKRMIHQDGNTFFIKDNNEVLMFSCINHATSVSTNQSLPQPPDQVLQHKKNTEADRMEVNLGSNQAQGAFQKVK